MLHLQHLNLQKTIQSNKKMKKGFTLVEIIVSLAVASILILITFNVLSQCLLTMNNSSITGSMDNYANSIHTAIKKELIGTKNLDVANMDSDSTTTKAITDPLGKITTPAYYKHLYYTNTDNYSYGIMCEPAKKGFDLYVVFSPVSGNKQTIKNLFNSSNSSNIRVTDFTFILDNYNVSNSDKIRLNSDYYGDSNRLIKYKFTLKKSSPKGIDTEKTYFFEEVLICQN